MATNCWTSIWHKSEFRLNGWNISLHWPVFNFGRSLFAHIVGSSQGLWRASFHTDGEVCVSLDFSWVPQFRTSCKQLASKTGFLLSIQIFWKLRPPFWRPTMMGISFGRLHPPLPALNVNYFCLFAFHFFFFTPVPNGARFFFWRTGSTRLDLLTFSRKHTLPHRPVCATSGPEFANSRMSSAKRRSAKLSVAWPKSKPAFPISVLHCRKAPPRSALNSRGPKPQPCRTPLVMEKLRLLQHSPVIAELFIICIFLTPRQSVLEWNGTIALVEVPTMLANVPFQMPLTSPNLQPTLWLQLRKFYPVEVSLSTIVLPILGLVERHVVPPVVSLPKSLPHGQGSDTQINSCTKTSCLQEVWGHLSEWHEVSWKQHHHSRSSGNNDANCKHGKHGSVGNGWQIMDNRLCWALSSTWIIMWWSFY